MAQQSDTLGTVIKVSIFAAIVVAAWLVYRWLSGYKGGDALGGSAKTPQGGAAAADNSVFGQIKAEYKDHIVKPAINDILAAELVEADVIALKFWNKPGSDVRINKILKKVNQLSDADYMDVVSKFVKLSGKSDFYDTRLVGAQIYTASHSDFLVRYENLTGKKATNTTDLHLANGAAVGAAGGEVGAAIAKAAANFPATLASIGGPAK